MPPVATFPSLPRSASAWGLALLLGFLASAPGLRADTPLNPAYTVVDLGTLGGGNSEGYGVNNAGQVTRRSYTTGEANQHAFLYLLLLAGLSALGMRRRRLSVRA